MIFPMGNGGDSTVSVRVILRLFGDVWKLERRAIVDIILAVAALSETMEPFLLIPPRDEGLDDLLPLIGEEDASDCNVEDNASPLPSFSWLNVLFVIAFNVFGFASVVL